MNKLAQLIRNRLSLRPPQAESLEILANLADMLSLKKNANLKKEELATVSKKYPTCSDFERNFPSVCFALATGVGKTRLMGAFIVYLFLAKGKKNFFVLAPNLTIYNKLIDDFSNMNSPKYVFQGIGEFTSNQPLVITGETYQNFGSKLLLQEDRVRINIFNVDKIRAESRGDSVPRIKRMAECLGDSYFEYLVNLPDLVLLMDESHRYRAERSMDVINELNPVLGLELTATPQIEKSSGNLKFKNVVYEYSLAKAIRDGWVKTPAIATREDFDPTQYAPEELDFIKLEDGIRVHEETKRELDIFSRNTKRRPVKPFVLVVAKETEHANRLLEMIRSPEFFKGYYADKVMDIHSNQRGSEKDENIERLLGLESPDNKIEIVIHVNMLKEGWDVTNLYTIIPLRTATSMTLREQTIGRGLRLPYGEKTGHPKVDKLTVIAHDKFNQLIEEANKPDSIINKENIIILNPSELSQSQEVVVSRSHLEEQLQEERRRIEQFNTPEEKQLATVDLELRQAVLETLPELGKYVRNINDITTPEIKQIALENAQKRLLEKPQLDLFIDDKLQQLKAIVNQSVEDYVQQTIEIPRISVTQSDEINYGFHDFDLDCRNLNMQPGSEDIIVHNLVSGDRDILIASERGLHYTRIENPIVAELMNFPEIDYDVHSHLLFKLAGQAITKFNEYLDEEQIQNVVQNKKRDIAQFIYTQMMDHFYVEAPSFEQPKVLPFVRIESQNFSKYTQDNIHNYQETIEPTSAIPKKVFGGFKKACHNLYKFDTKTEKDFATLLERDDSVSKWLRPAPNQFNIYWAHNAKRYEPDFVVETATDIFLIETKKESDLTTSEVQDKRRAAIEYCRHASNYTRQHRGKPWTYVLIPHNAVTHNSSLDYLVNSYKQELADSVV